MNLPVPVVTVGLLVASNLFMTIAWYGHLKFKSAPLLTVILVSWGIAFFEYVLQVPANRIGYGHFSAAQLKTIQEVISLSVFVLFSWAYLGEKITLNVIAGFALICLGAFLIFHNFGTSH
ncbi:MULTISPECIES: DMT family protein [unclassified Paracoccus (in: a-proteobacteria)]|uniref:DMT family protein n=1 Tax=unclassified Paracoccus (in: a-proteobacteria) TaxID=2688777 RepID=UPI0012B1DC8E|nr:MULTISPECIES: DMT family protein [unclassified Paracoccus (in: a-proteobacteria)]UXU74876.1 DMT family protein [Paracoccus sp. SMMA_5]UXU80777.1 DMT family protein [Paracoccus sp. SMMA_5_TC]